jgi:uncharacterized protein YnzC (UPF0291/DUF896 family)
MPKAKVGTLIKIDVATKIFLMKLPEAEKFILMDIDDRHLFIQESYLEEVQAKVKQHKEKVRRVDESEVNEEQFFIA